MADQQEPCMESPLGMPHVFLPFSLLSRLAMHLFVLQNQGRISTNLVRNLREPANGSEWANQLSELNHLQHNYLQSTSDGGE